MFQDNQYSLDTRGEAAGILIKNIITVQPVLGFGPANYYNYSALFPISGYYVRFNSHNQYLDLLAQVGLLGTICYIWFFGTVMVNARRLFRSLQPGFGRAYAAGILSLAVGLLVCGLLADWVLPFVYNIGLAGMRSSVVGWMFMGGLVVLANQPGSEQSKEEGGASG
jgi:O-antigen ligase